VRICAKHPERGLGLVLLAALVVPLILAAVALFRLEWAPLFDMALVEQRVRAVGTPQTPLLGLAGRLGSLERPAAHPGPLVFYLLVPVYRLFGSSAWALSTSVVALNAAAVTLALWAARRSGGFVGLCLTFVALALLAQGYGFRALSEPWTPYIALLWFSVCLVASWSVLVGDRPVLPLAVFAGSLVAQTHVSYVPLVGGGLLVAMGAVTLTALRSSRSSVERTEALRALGIACALGCFLSVPPLIEALSNDGGNLKALWRYFSEPEGERLGIAGALPVVLERLDPGHIALRPLTVPGIWVDPLALPRPRPVFGAALLTVWVACFGASLWMRHRRLVALHVLVLTTLGLALAAVSRIVGFHPIQVHVVLWGWTLGMLCLTACLATLGYLVSRLKLAAKGPWPGRPGAARWVALALALAFGVRLSALAIDTKPGDYTLAHQAWRLAEATLLAVGEGVGAAGGTTPRYLMSWTDFAYFGAQGFAVGMELERAGYSVRYEPVLAPLVGRGRTAVPGWPRTRIHLVTGDSIAKIRRLPGAREVASVDLRGEEERRQARAREETLRRRLMDDGHPELDRESDILRALGDAFDLDANTAPEVREIVELGVPAAVFILPLDVSPY
jgi:hypothetical protein